VITPGRATATQFGSRWPLKVKSGRLLCRPPSLAIFQDDSGKIYALNGLAQGCVENPTHPTCEGIRLSPIDPIWEADPKFKKQGLKISIGPLIDAANALCER